MTTDSEKQPKSSALGDLSSRWVHSFLGLLRSRLELFLFELEEEKVRLVELLLWLVSLVIFGLIFLGVASAAIVFLLPSDWRAAGLLVLSTLYGLIACFSVFRIKALLSRETTIFEESISQLKKDQACFSDRK